MRGGPGLALGIRSLLALVVTPDRAFARSYVEGELNQGKAEPQLERYDEAARFGKLARAANPAAQFYMGRLTAMGLGAPQDLPEATEWCLRSAKQGHVVAQAVLGLHYMEGIRHRAELGRGGALVDSRRGQGPRRRLLQPGQDVRRRRTRSARGPRAGREAAVARGFPDPLRAHAEPARRAPEALAISKEGDRLFSAGDMAGAARTYARCADMGDASCPLNLGWLYEQGKGVPPEAGPRGTLCYRAAAEQNNPKAEENLGNMYQLGRRGPDHVRSLLVAGPEVAGHLHRARLQPQDLGNVLTTPRRNSTLWHSIS